MVLLLFCLEQLFETVHAVLQHLLVALQIFDAPIALVIQTNLFLQLSGLILHANRCFCQPGLESVDLKVLRTQTLFELIESRAIREAGLH